ncbi:MAG: AAA domain-containing protein [Desulfofustis sp.]|nr:AAA domain-containing protein [Desulfofustis sp.]
MERQIFPFSALVGQEELKTGLLLNAVDPAIGGILVSGQKGTGKSTAVRALARVLPRIEAIKDCPYNCAPDDVDNLCIPCAEDYHDGRALKTEWRPMPLVELPLSATEDRVVGTLHIEQVLKTGARRFEPGLLASANRGILYVDEVNLLDDHLVDILLDAAASGVNRVERESISYAHPSLFMLIGTMNPEEGELRPQFLDRFGLSIGVTGVDHPLQRRLIVDRRIEFDTNPQRFIDEYGEDELVLTEQVSTARSALQNIEIPGAMVEMAVALASEVRAQGHRAEIGIIKAARALAAFLERSEVGPEHVVEAARFVLPHRITTLSFATSEQIDEQLDEVFKKVLDRQQGQETMSEAEGIPDGWADIDEQVPGSTAASNVGMLFSFLAEKKKLSTSRIP